MSYDEEFYEKLFAFYINQNYTTEQTIYQVNNMSFSFFNKNTLRLIKSSTKDIVVNLLISVYKNLDSEMRNNTLMMHTETNIGLLQDLLEAALTRGRTAASPLSKSKHAELWLLVQKLVQDRYVVLLDTSSFFDPGNYQRCKYFLDKGLAAKLNLDFVYHGRRSTDKEKLEWQFGKQASSFLGCIARRGNLELFQYFYSNKYFS